MWKVDQAMTHPFEDAGSESRRFLTSEEGELSSKLFDVTMSEFLGDSSKHFRRGLVLSSFIALIVGSFSIEFESFLGFRVVKGAVAPEILCGLLFFVVCYYCISYTVNLTLDWLAWDYKRDRVRASQYLSLFEGLNNEIEVTFKGLDAVLNNIKHVYGERVLFNDSDSVQLLESMSQEIVGVRNKFREFEAGFVNDFLLETNILSTVGRLNLRSRMKILTTIVVDVAFPLMMAVLAVVKTHEGVPALLSAFLR